MGTRIHFIKKENMKEYIEIGPTPYEEKCAQVGEDYFIKRAGIEMDIFIEQLYRTFTEATDKRISFVKKWYNHDFGQYGEVCIKFDPDDEEASDYAYYIDKNSIPNWDEDSLNKIKEMSNG